MNGTEWWQHPFFAVSFTVLTYVFAVWLNRHLRVHPLFTASMLLIICLLVMDVPYETYRQGADLLVILLGPATVALAIPLYKHMNQIGRFIRPIIVAVSIGSLSGLLTAGWLTWLFYGSHNLVQSMLPKSVTTPIAVELADHLGGVMELTAVLTVLTGLLNSMIGPTLLRWAGVRGDISIGVAVGTAAHGIGTARLLQFSEKQGSMSSLAMALAGIIVGGMVIPLYYLG